MWDESLDYLYELDKFKYETQYELDRLKYETQYELDRLKYETQLQEMIYNNQMEILNNKIYSTKNKEEPFITIYKKEMPKGSYFEGCVLELIGKNPNYNFNY